MHVLIVKVGLPHPHRGGGANRAFQLLRALKIGGDRVTLVSAIRNDDEPYLDVSRELCDDVDVVSYLSCPPWRLPVSSGISRIDRYLMLAAEPPYRYTYTFAPALLSAVQARLDAGTVDCVVADNTGPALILAPIVRTRRLAAAANLFDIESVANRRSIRLERTGPSVWLTAKDLFTTAKIRAAERSIADSFPLCVVTSEHDVTALNHVAKRQVGAVVVPNGVDTSYFSPTRIRPGTPPTLVFTGAMSYPPNADAVQYFCAEILPLIRQHYPTVRFLVVGVDPPAEVRRLDQGDGGQIRILGTVPDVRPYLTEAHVAVVPLRSGSGTRLKILEALAMERPVVSTSVGAEGLVTVDGSHLLLGNGPTAFANAVIRVLGDPNLAESLAVNGRALVEERYRWDTIGAAWRGYLHELVDRSRTGV